MRSKILRLILPLGLLAVFTAISASRISFNLDALDLLPPNVPEVESFTQLMTHFSRKNELIVTLETGDDPYLAEDAMRSLVDFLESELADEIASVRGELPLLEKPELGAELIAWMWLNGEPAALRDFAEQLEPGKSSARLESAMAEIQSGFLSERSILLGYDPLGITQFPADDAAAFLSGESNGFESADGDFRVIFIEANVAEFPTYQDGDRWVKRVLSSIEAWKETATGTEGEALDLSEVALDFTGEPVIASEIARSMEKDLVQSVIFTTIVICALFWLMHRRLAPLFWLVLMLAVVFSGTFAAGGLILGQLTAMSIGFAAILIGLAVDYGVVLYRERSVANGDAKVLRRQIGPGILWAAATTAAVFVSMNFSTLPGVRELGTLVALGIAIGAAVMLGMFAPVVAAVPSAPFKTGEAQPKSVSTRPSWIVTGVVALASIGTILITGMPEVNRKSRPFNLRDSSAINTMKNLQARMQTGGVRSMPLLVTAGSEAELATKAAAAKIELETELEKGLIRSFKLPTVMVPNPANQKANADFLKSGFLEMGPRLVSEIEAAGFTEASSALTKKVFHDSTLLSQRLDPVEPREGQNVEDQKKRFRDSTGYVLPQNAASQWLTQRMISRKEGEIVLLGELVPIDEESFVNSPLISESGSFQVAGWPLLTPAMHRVIERDFIRVFLPMGVILLGMLLVVFRDWRDVLLSLGALAFAAISLIALTLWLPIEWNFFNLTGIPILFGTGLDYSIHMIFALRRSNGDREIVKRGIGRALLFCGCSTAVGFGSLSFAGTQGLSTLGVICGAGILLNMAIAVWLLPNWWRSLHGKRGVQSKLQPESTGPAGL